MTSTVNLLFGSRLIVPTTGVIMNNEMNDFSIPDVHLPSPHELYVHEQSKAHRSTQAASNAFGFVPSPANFIRPGKRPLSSISPAIVEHLSNGSLYFVGGSAGGSRIITATIQNLWNVLDKGLSSAQSLGQPRFHDQLQPNKMFFEYSYDNSTVAAIAALGHNVTWVAPGQSTAQALRYVALLFIPYIPYLYLGPAFRQAFEKLGRLYVCRWTNDEC